MAHFAEIDANGVVLRVIVAEQDFIDSAVLGSPKNWIQTSYNTHAGEHLLGGVPMRKNYAGIGYTYDKIRDAFIPPKAFDSWQLNEQKGMYEAPIPHPKDGKGYLWNEKSRNWDEVIN